MLLKASFSQGLHPLLKQNQYSKKEIGGVIQKYAEKCYYFDNFNANDIIFVYNQVKCMPIWNLVFKFI